MISTNCWIPRGVAKEFPEQYVLNDEEVEKISALAKLQIADAEAEAVDQDEVEQEDEDEEIEEDNVEAQDEKKEEEVDDELKEYDFDNYDNEPDSAVATFLPGISGAKFVQESEDADPYLTLESAQEKEEDKEELQIYDTDNLILSGRTEDGVSYVDVYVYDDGAGDVNSSNEDELIRESNLYVHHDLMVPAFPLCTEWVDVVPGNIETTGNFAAIGTFDPQIELWNLDYIDKAFPDAILGETITADSINVKKSKSKKGKKRATKVHELSHHTDAVLSLSHNKNIRSMLASSSADCTVKIWDLQQLQAVYSWDTLHNQKSVSSIQWHPSDANKLLSGGYDGKVCVSSGSGKLETKKWSVRNGEEVECATWAQEHIFMCGTDSGVIYAFDERGSDEPLWKIQAHDCGISSLQPNKFVPGMVVTGGMKDEKLKLWRVPYEPLNNDNKPTMVLSRDLGVGNVLSASFACDMEVAGHLVAGGSNGPLKIWDAFSNKSVRKRFSEPLKQLQQTAKEIAEKNGKSSRLAQKYGKGFDEQLFEADNRENEDAEDMNDDED